MNQVKLRDARLAEGRRYRFHFRRTAWAFIEGIIGDASAGCVGKPIISLPFLGIKLLRNFGGFLLCRRYYHLTPPDCPNVDLVETGERLLYTG